MTEDFRLTQLMRWFGPNDIVTLSHIRQAGCTGVVTALHSIPVGEEWRLEDIRSLKAEIESQNLLWEVVESLPVHEDIKTRSGNHTGYIENYKKSLINLSQCNIKVVTYNFMPVLDWVRTDIEYKLENGAKATVYNKLDLAVFDLWLLRRENAGEDYTLEEIRDASGLFKSMSTETKKKVFQNVLRGLPGSDTSFTTGQILNLIRPYNCISREKFRDHLIYFLKEVTPVAEAAGIRLAIHPDDPPFSVLGIPRIVSTEEDIDEILSEVPNAANGLCFCTGSLGARKENDLVKMIKKWAPRIYFLHLRNIKRMSDYNFMETGFFEGDNDMCQIMREVIEIMNRERRSIPVRPDHGLRILDDLNRETYPGYAAIGRLKSLAEIRGLERGMISSS